MLFNKILTQIKKLQENPREDRSLWIEVELDKCPHGDEQRTHYIKSMVARIFTEVISIGFNLHFKEGLQFEKAKAYICENILLNFCNLCISCQVSCQDLQIVEQHLKDQVLPFINLNYPRSEEKLNNLQNLVKIDEKDIYNENKFDIVYSSKIVLSTRRKDINA